MKAILKWVAATWNSIWNFLAVKNNIDNISKSQPTLQKYAAIRMIAHEIETIQQSRNKSLPKNLCRKGGACI